MGRWGPTRSRSSARTVSFRRKRSRATFRRSSWTTRGKILGNLGPNVGGACVQVGWAVQVKARQILEQGPGLESQTTALQFVSLGSHVVDRQYAVATNAQKKVLLGLPSGFMAGIYSRGNNRF